MIQAKGTKGFFLWLRGAMPRLYADVKREFSDSAQLSGVGIAPTDPVTLSTEAPASRSLSQTIQDIANIAAQAYLTKEQIKSQQQILNLQLQRAQQGQPPLDIDPMKYGIPQPSVGVGLTADTKQLLTWGAAGVAAMFLFSQLTPRRQRR